jgi:hypothetical protein
MADEQVQDENPIDKAEKVAARLEEANKRHEELIKRQEALEARRVLGGKSEGGTAPAPKKDIPNRDYADAALKGRILK